jgi:hypothetical protein
VLGSKSNLPPFIGMRNTQPLFDHDLAARQLIEKFGEKAPNQAATLMLLAANDPEIARLWRDVLKAVLAREGTKEQPALH